MRTPLFMSAAGLPLVVAMMSMPVQAAEFVVTDIGFNGLQRHVGDASGGHLRCRGQTSGVVRQRKRGRIRARHQPQRAVHRRRSRQRHPHRRALQRIRG